jgi:hypothetical protein
MMSLGMLLSYNVYVHRVYHIEHDNKATTQGLLKRGSAGTSVQNPKRQEGVCETLKGPIALD